MTAQRKRQVISWAPYVTAIVTLGTVLIGIGSFYRTVSANTQAIQANTRAIQANSARIQAIEIHQATQSADLKNVQALLEEVRRDVKTMLQRTADR